MDARPHRTFLELAPEFPSGPRDGGGCLCVIERHPGGEVCRMSCEIIVSRLSRTVPARQGGVMKSFRLSPGRGTLLAATALGSALAACVGAPQAQAQFACTNFNTGTASGATAAGGANVACGTGANASGGTGSRNTAIGTSDASGGTLANPSTNVATGDFARASGNGSNNTASGGAANAIGDFSVNTATGNGSFASGNTSG